MINMLEAKSNLSRLVEQIESGAQREIVIARNGRPVARLVPLAGPAPAKRIGVARGQFEPPADIDQHNAEIVTLLRGQPEQP